MLASEPNFLSKKDFCCTSTRVLSDIYVFSIIWLYFAVITKKKKKKKKKRERIERGKTFFFFDKTARSRQDPSYCCFLFLSVLGVFSLVTYRKQAFLQKFALRETKKQYQVDMIIVKKKRKESIIKYYFLTLHYCYQFFSVNILREFDQRWGSNCPS